MFTGIIEETGMVESIKKDKSNLHISIKSSFLKEIKVDQSIAHNGVCLTVVDKKKNHYIVTAIAETLSKTNLKFLKTGDLINLERCMKADGRFDGHIVQGHVDSTANVDSIKEQDGSWIFSFSVQSPEQGVQNLIVEKGSICVNGVSLTVVDFSPPLGRQKPGGLLRGPMRMKEGASFSVAIIPYTFQHTNFHSLKTGDSVNIEFDIIGKYVSKILRTRSL